MNPPELFYCAAGNPRLADIAIGAGLHYGARLPGTVKRPIEFADQDWKNPDLNKYIASVAKHKPRIGTVLDWEKPEQLTEVLNWAESIAPYVETIVIIPKVLDGIWQIPERIGGKEVRLGVPCGPAENDRPPVWEFGSRPVHILGGPPQKQMIAARYFNAQSADCSVTAYMARKLCAFWTPTRVHNSNNRWWVQLGEAGLGEFGKDSFYKAFEISCNNIFAGWNIWSQGGL